MARNISASVENNFSGGVVTEATGLNFPKDACTEADNCIFHERGFVHRRPGFDFEENFAVKAINRTNSVVNSYLWKNVTGDGSTNLLVLQVGGTLYFYLPEASTGFSANALSTTITLSSFLASGAPSGSAALSECDFAAGIGYLLVVHPNLDPFYITYDTALQTVSGTEINIQIRDTEGLDDDLAVDERPNTLSTAHNYNLKNQGWYISSTYVSNFNTDVGDYPSNADVWWVYKNFDDEFDTSTVSTIYVRGTSEAPKGHYILDAFNQDRSTASGVVGITAVTSSYYRPSTVAFFSGRAWYAGVNYAGFESKVYFSQIIENNVEFGKCYQNSDPTNENFNELNAADGGYVLIPGAGLIYKLVPVNSSILVFAANGVWIISGSSKTGFTAEDYSVSLVSSIRTLSATSFVDVDGYPAWWSLEGIQQIVPREDGTGVSVKSLTDKKIKQLYLDIPLVSKSYARGSYDPRSHTVQWIYRSTEASTLVQTYSFDKVLNLNTIALSFYEWTLPTSDVKVNGLFLTEGFGSVPAADTVVVGADSIIVGSGNPVTITSYGSALLDFANKFIVSYPESSSYKFTFADYANTNYVDWVSYDDEGVDYSSYFVTGYKVPTEGQRKFQSNYIYIFSDLTEIEETDFHFQGIWNFANTGDSGKYTSRQRVTHAAGSNFDVVRNRLKVRGSGYAVQFKFSSISGEPFHIIGWSVFESANKRD